MALYAIGVWGFWGVLRFTRKQIIAMAAGAILAGGPLIAFDYWVSRLIERQSVEDVDASAKRAVALADARVTQVITALDSLAARGGASCSPESTVLMRRTVFETVPIKGIAVIGPDGEIMCTNGGKPVGARKALIVEALPGAKNFSLEGIRLDATTSMVRIVLNTGPNRLSAIVPSELFVPQVSTQGSQLSAHAVMTTAQGTVIGESGRAVAPADLASAVRVEHQSSKYGFTLSITLPRSAVGQSDLTELGLIAKAVFAIFLVGFALLLPKRTPSDPVGELQRALDAGEFIPYYQPIVDIRSGQLRGAEVLVRWRKSDGSLVLPGAFIPLFESSGLIAPLTRALMRQVCAEVGGAIGARPSLKISFNLAAQLVRSDTIVKDIRNAFASSRIGLSQVVLELTERDQIEDLAETRRILSALQGIGVRIAIDDVGTGHSGLSYILKLGVDIIKIDKMFVDALGTDRNSTTIVETLIDLAHNLRMDVVAEGVENFEQVMHLRELGVRSAQGYVFAPPLPGSAFLQLVDAIDPLPTVEGRTAGAAQRYMSARNRFSAA
jgi:sensor c-di-GMP phosphodiesterase-like protein